MKKTKFYTLSRLLMLSIFASLFILASCNKKDDPEPEVIDESAVLVEYLESTGGTVINTFANMVTATAIHDEPDQYYVIDIRPDTTFAAGHIPGAHNVAAEDVLAYYEENNLQEESTVVFVCFSGQTAAWVNGLMQTMGYTNCKDLKWGMCSWNAATAGSWTGTNVGDGFVGDMVTTETTMNEAGDLPTLSTGKTKAEDILRARVEAVFAEGFAGVKTTSSTVFGATSSYYIVNYWSKTDYDWNHIPTAVQYTPKESLTSDTYLNTLPTDMPIAVYCYTGQTSAHVAAYLRVLGYDAKTILFGVNGMAHSTMPSHAFNPDTEIHDFDLETGN